MHDIAMPFSKKIENYDILEQIGRGGFAVVHRAKCLLTGRIVAIKMIDKQHARGAKMQNIVVQEVTIHAMLKHPSILELYTYFADDKYMYLVLELAENGSLKQLVDRRFRLKEEETAQLISQVVHGLLFLHVNRILHRDISLGNLLLTKDNSIKIADFGLATKLNTFADKHMTMCGTPNYISPEVVSREYGLPTDVWGVGVVLYHLLVGRAPFEAESSEGEVIKTTFTNIVKKDHELPSFLSYEAKDLIDRLLCKSQNHRITLDEVLDHPFITTNLLALKYNKSMASSVDSGISRTMSSQNISNRNPFTRSRSEDRNKKQLSIHYEIQATNSSSSYKYERGDEVYGNANEYISSPRSNLNRYRSMDLKTSNDAIDVKEPYKCSGNALRDLSNNCHYDTGQMHSPHSPSPHTIKSYGQPYKFTAVQSPYVPTVKKPPIIEAKLDIAPLTTARLPPYEYNIQKFTFKIESNGDLIIENNCNGRENKVENVYRISGDGLRIVVQKPNSCGVRDCSYSYSNLPQVHWNKYKIASKFIKYLREKTPIVTYYTAIAKSELMVTLKDFKMMFETGEKIIKSENDVKIIDIDGHTWLPNVGRLSESNKLLWEHYEHCLSVCQRFYETANQLEPSGCCFPITMGQRPQSSKSRSGEGTPQTPSISSFALSSDSPLGRMQNKIR